MIAVKGVSVFAALLVLLCARDARADEQNTPDDAELQDAGASSDTETDGAQTGTTTPVAPDEADKPPTKTRHVTHLAPLTKAEQRRLVRHAREVIALQQAMVKEGPTADDERYARYRALSAGGVTLITVGAAASVLGPIIWLFASLGSVVADPEEPGDGGGDAVFGALIGMVVGGVTAIGAGIPLLVAGKRGKKRQKLLRRKEEILAPFDPRAAPVLLSLFADPERGAGGLRLQLTF